ncbi:NAD(P)-binding domain-containing protein [soil metagenome]
MSGKKTIAIVGATGNMGNAIAKSLAKGNYRILLIGSNSEKLQALYNEIHILQPLADMEIMNCAFEGCWEADIIIPAVPYTAEKEVAAKIKDVATGKIVISISNPLNETYTALVTDTGKSAGEELQDALPYSKVIKAFNTIYAEDFAEPVIDDQTIDSLIAGNDEEALQIIAQLVALAGFNPVIAGDLSVSSSMENMQLMLIQLSMKNNYSHHAGWKILHD